MEINILKEDKKKIEIEIVGEDSTLINALKDELWNNDAVEVVASNIEHPLVSHPTLILEVNKKNPREIILSAADSLKEKFKELKEDFDKKC
ncbi:MAG: DNA-directed RNA polymerase subunit L [archaeon]